MEPTSPKKLSTKLIVVGILLLIGGGVAYAVSRRKKALPDGGAPPDTTPAPQVTKNDQNLLKLAKTYWKGAVTSTYGLNLALNFIVGEKIQHVVNEDGAPGQYLPLKGTLTVNKVALPLDGSISPDGRVMLNGRKKHSSGQHFMLNGKLGPNSKTMRGSGDGVVDHKSRDFNFTATRS